MTARTIVITGAGRGLGRALTERFVEAGHTVLGCSRQAPHVEALAKQFGKPHRFDAVDVTDDAAVGRWANALLSEYGPPDLLLNNAAVVNENAVLWEVPEGQFSRVIDVNIKGVYHVLRHFVPAMVAKKRGVIVNFSSGWGRSTSPEVAPYCATKYAIEGLTLALAQELPSGMCAVPLNPGIIDTDMLRSCFGGHASEYPSPDKWSKTGAPFLLALGPKDNGKSVSVPGM